MPRVPYAHYLRQQRLALEVMRLMLEREKARLSPGTVIEGEGTADVTIFCDATDLEVGPDGVWRTKGA